MDHRPSAVPAAGGPASTAIAGRSWNHLALVSLATAILGPFGNAIGVGGITLIIISLVTGHMARSEIKRTGEKGATVALIGLVISYVHLAVITLIVIFFFGAVLALLTLLLHVVTSGG